MALLWTPKVAQSIGWPVKVILSGLTYTTVCCITDLSVCRINTFRNRQQFRYNSDFYSDCTWEGVCTRLCPNDSYKFLFNKFPSATTGSTDLPNYCKRYFHRHMHKTALDFKRQQITGGPWHDMCLRTEVFREAWSVFEEGVIQGGCFSLMLDNLSPFSRKISVEVNPR